MSDETIVDDSEPTLDLPTNALVTRSIFGGILMGLANLVPGISGGTMLLAAGIYPRFIESISEITRFRFRGRSLLVLGCVGAAAGIAILLLAGLLKDLVVDHRWIMYSLFIGLTLGGVPIVWKLAKPLNSTMVVSGAIAFLAMVGLAILEANEIVGGTGTNFAMLFCAGLAGASAMILPGISGGYLLLLMGQYVPILAGIDQFKEALKSRDVSAAMEPLFSVVLPVGIGVVTGIVVVGNLLQWLLKRFRKATLGALLGLLLGSAFGLWPFKHAVEPQVGDTLKGQVLTAENIVEVESKDWANEHFIPEMTQIAGSLALIGVGFGVTLGVSAFGSSRKESKPESVD